MPINKLLSFFWTRCICLFSTTGGYDDPDHNTYLDQILQYDASNQSWAQVGTMFECRAYHAVSVIDMDQLAKYCK